MPVMLEDPDSGRRAVRRELRERHGVQTSILYPAAHEFSVYVERLGELSLPRTELAARSEVTIPLYPHMTESEQDTRRRGPEGGTRCACDPLTGALDSRDRARCPDVTADTTELTSESDDRADRAEALRPAGRVVGREGAAAGVARVLALAVMILWSRT